MAGKIVIVGAGGRLGQALERELSDDCDILGVARNDLELSDQGAVEKFFEQLDFSCVIVPAALTAVDYCEDHEEEAYAVNAVAPEVIARVCRKRGARMIHYSTDFVFDGEKEGPYREADAVRPLSVYGASKLEGERKVFAVGGDAVVLRLAWVFGPDRPGFPEWIVGQAEQSESLKLPGDKIGSPSFTRDVAKWTGHFLPGGKAGAAQGVFHLGNSGSCTWREWGEACLRAAKERGRALRTTSIVAGKLADVEAFVAPRPRNSALDPQHFAEVTGVEPRPWEMAVQAHFDEVCGRI